MSKAHGTSTQVVHYVSGKSLSVLSFHLLSFQGGFWIPTDGVASPSDVALAMAKKAKEMGKTESTYQTMVDLSDEVAVTSGYGMLQYKLSHLNVSYLDTRIIITRHLLLVVSIDLCYK